MSINLLTRLDPLRRIVCPVCLNRVALCQLHIRCDKACQATQHFIKPDPILTRALQGRRASDHPASALQSVWWTDPLADQDRGLRRFLDWLILPASLDCPVCHQAAEARLCPQCHAHLPDSILDHTSSHIAIFGPQSVGKSTLITVLIHELSETIGPKLGFVLDPLNEETAQRYRYEYRPKVYGLDDRALGEARDPAFLPYGHQASPPSEDNPEILRPLIYRLTIETNGRHRSTLLSFFDCAGEDWESRSESFRGEAQYMTQASGLLFLVDPLRIEAVASDRRLKLTHKELSARPANYADDIRHLGSFFEIRGRKLPSRVPLAVCLNKLDRWGPQMPPGTLLAEVATSVPGASPLPSNLDDTVHEEVKAAIERWTGESFSRQLDLKFPNHRFFAVSSLGDAAQTDEETPLALPTPLLVDQPILWLLKQQGLLVKPSKTPKRSRNSP